MSYPCGPYYKICTWYSDKVHRCVWPTIVVTSKVKVKSSHHLYILSLALLNSENKMLYRSLEVGEGILCHLNLAAKLRFTTRKATRYKGVTNAIRHALNLCLASCDLDLWPPDPEVDCFMPLPRGPFVPIGIKFCFQNIVLSTSITDERKDPGWEHYGSACQFGQADA